MDYLPEDLRKGLKVARDRAARKESRLRVQVDHEVFPILRFTPTEFATSAATASHLRGLVDIYDGSRHMYQALIVTSAQEGDDMVYEFKRMTKAIDRPPLDHVEPDDKVAGLLPKA